MIKIEHPALGSIKAVTVGSIVKRFHRLFNFLLNSTILCLKVKWAVFKYYILSLRNIHYLHLFRNFTRIIRRKPYSTAFRQRNTPAFEKGRTVLPFLMHSSITSTIVCTNLCHSPISCHTSFLITPTLFLSS